MRALVDAIPRGAFAVLLLAIALAASLLLAWQAFAAAASHRATSEGVLRDYAGLAASELMRRGASEVGYQGHYVLVEALARANGSRRSLDEGKDARTRRAAALLGRTFTVDTVSRRVSLEGAGDAVVSTWLAEHAQPPAERGPYAVLTGIIGGAARTFVIAAPRSDRLFGYEVEAGGLGSFLAAALDEGPLLPPSLAHGRVGNDRLGLVVHDPAGREVFRRGTAWSGALKATATGDDAYAGTLRGFVAEVEIDPSAASELIIGGLPRSRLPQVLALTGLAAGLLAATFVQLRRERALERLRSEFVASASHELRTPLTQIRMFAETLRLGRVRSEEERERALEVIDRESRRLGHLVENLLQFSRSGRGVRPSDTRPRDLGPLVEEVVDSFRPLAAGAGSALRVEVAKDVWAKVEADACRQVLLNLLDNAVKYGPRGQEVVVMLEESSEHVRLAVEDEGPGIPAAERERVFERFHRLERDHDSTVTGTGLGLAVVRELVARSGGRCWVEGTSGGGARVVVELLRARPERPMTRVLVIEDNADLAFGLRNNLEIEGYEVQVSPDGRAGLAAARAWRPHLVVLDLMLPGLDGLRVLKALREDPGPPVLILTAKGEEADKVRGLKLGADDYVTKPFGLLELLARVEALLRRAQRGSARRVDVFGSIEVDVGARTVRKGGRAIELTPKELDLLLALLEADGSAVSRLDLLRRVWGYPAAVVTRTVDTHVAELRRKLEDDPSRPRHVLTVRKLGYRLLRSPAPAEPGPPSPP